MIIAVAIFYFLFVLMDCISVIPRIAGSHCEKNGLAYSFSVLINTIKRVFVVAYPPVLGWIAVSGGEGLLSAIFLSYLFGVFAVFTVCLTREWLISFFIHFINLYSVEKSISRSFLIATRKVQFETVFNFSNLIQFKNVDFKLALLAAWVYFIYGTSLFIVNVIGFVFSQYSAVVYQLVGLVNALGTIVYSFVLDPKISVIFESKGDVIETHNSLLLSQMISLVFFGPISILALASLLF